MATSTDDGDIGLNQEATDEEVKLLTDEAPPGDAPAATPPPSPSAEDNEDEDDQHEGDATGKNDAELAEAADEAAREAIRERRRLERAAKKAKSREKLEALERQVRMLAEQNQTLVQQVSGIQNVNHGNQLAQLDTHIQQHENAVAHFENALADATTKGDGAGVVEAMRARDAARDRLRDLQGLKRRVTAPTTNAPAVNPVMVQHVQSFLSKHKWYGGPQSPDIDSRMLKVIDDSVAADGFDPTTPAYYEELEKRGRERLPHRFGAASPPPPAPAPSGPRRSPVAGAGGEGGGKPGGGANYELSAERVKAMKEAGIWDDPVKREKLIKRYQQADKEAAGARK